MPATTIVNGGRPCSRCHVVKPLSAEHFHRNRCKAGGFSSTCKECFAREVDAPRVARDRDRRLAKARSDYMADPASKLASNRAWKQNNRARSYEIDARYLANRLDRDPVFKFSRRISSVIRRSMNGAKAGHGWEQLVGYTVLELRSHLERQFDQQMSWGNYGTYWHIDHIKPVSAFQLSPDRGADEIVAQAKLCWTLSNLQPLPAIENLRKGARFAA